MAPSSAQATANRAKTSATGRRANAARSIVPAQHVFLLLLAFRIVNALTLRTLYVPDEYYQSLEPAWQLAFGPNAGAWITWEWRHQLRSSLHPILFASVYKAAALFCKVAAFTPETTAAVLLAAPKVAQAFFAAGLDFYTWRLAQRIFGPGSRAAWTILAVTVTSPWQWFVSTRTLSNSLEASLTAAALHYWPWGWMLPANADELRSPQRLRKHEAPHAVAEDRFRLRIVLLLAATASILRPTNVLVWIPIALQTLSKVSTRYRQVLLLEAVACGSTIAGLTALADWWFYGFPTFPPYRFLTFNIHQDLAVFYGVHRWDYYLTEGLPLLLLGALPFAIFGMYKSASNSLRSSTSASSYSLETIVLPNFTWTIVFVVTAMSFISHKEARFVYPLLPCLHILAGNSVFLFLRRLSIWKGFILGVIVLLHVLFATFVSQNHQAGVVDVLHHIRGQHISRVHTENTTVAFLMPCHSTPWRSHLIDQSIQGWALTCEPPVSLPLAERAKYMDEADEFYASPMQWLETNMEPFESLENSSIERQSAKDAAHTERTANGQVTGQNRPWPQHLVFFKQLEPQMREMVGGRYKECWRGFNTYWHDDWRRKGDVVVWCLSLGS